MTITDDQAAATDTMRKAHYQTMLREAVPLIYHQVCAELGFDPNGPVMVPNPSHDQLVRGKRVTKKVMGRLKRRQVPPPATDTVDILNDDSIKPDTVEVPTIAVITPLSGE